MSSWSRKDREEYNKTRREWYQKNKDSERKRLRTSNKKRELEYRTWFRELKSTLKCEECPEDNVATLDFHHRDPSQKEMAVSDLVKRQWSKKRILEEIDKCSVLCSNCHRKLHWKDIL